MSAQPGPVQPLLIRRMGLQPYATVWEAMRRYTDSRHVDSEDALWSVQHPAVFTQGQAGKAEHILDPGGIPVVQIDRGGQVTYHGPGQLVVYLLLDLRRRGLGPRDLVDLIEQSLIALLADYGVEAGLKPGAPGVYVGEAKIAALGLRVRRGCSYHGLSLNVDMDLTPFSFINPCGYAGMASTQLREVMPGPLPDNLFENVEDALLAKLNAALDQSA